MVKLKEIADIFSFEIRACTGESTAHAIPRLLALNEKRSVKIFWTISWLIAATLFLYHFYTLSSTFFSNPVATTISYNQVHFQFPDVTICSLIPFSYRFLEKTGKASEFVKLSSNNTEDIEKIISPAEIQVQNFIIACEYSGELCDYNIFTKMEDPNYKSCFIFSPKTREIENGGPDFGLKLVIYAENRHNHLIQKAKLNFPDEWGSAGARITIQPARSHPHPTIHGFDLMPGTLSRIALSYEEVTLLPRKSLDSPPCLNTSNMIIGTCDLHSQDIEKFMYAFANYNTITNI